MTYVDGFVIPVPKKRLAAYRKISAKVMKDPRLKMDGAAMPFDMKRMSYGGFKVFVDA
ncbi:MAG: DUF1428 family protein [Alphaproteobacteria bacterium]|nr:DUF1428 family protein [Alphaproteobacteria bacterium]